MRDVRRARLVLAILVLTAVTFIVLDLRGSTSGPLAPFRSLAATIFGPIERAVSSIVSPVGSFIESLGSLGDKDATIASLQQQVDELRAEVATSAFDRERADAFDALLGLSADAQLTIVPGQIIAVGPAQGFAWTVTVDAGSLDGIEVDMSVVSGGGLVGRVISVGPTTSTILLVVDATSTVGGRLAGTSQIGIVSGTGRQDVMSMQLLDPLAPVEAGDVVVTFGSQGGRPFVPGIPIGTVTEVRGSPGQLSRVALIAPFVDVSSLEVIGIVLQGPRENPRAPIEPPAPAPTPTPTPTPSPTLTPDGGL